MFVVCLFAHLLLSMVAAAAGKSSQLFCGHEPQSHYVYFWLTAEQSVLTFYWSSSDAVPVVERAPEEPPPFVVLVQGPPQVSQNFWQVQ